MCVGGWVQVWVCVSEWVCVHMCVGVGVGGCAVNMTEAKMQYVSRRKSWCVNGNLMFGSVYLSVRRLQEKTHIIKFNINWNSGQQKLEARYKRRQASHLVTNCPRDLKWQATKWHDTRDTRSDRGVFCVLHRLHSTSAQQTPIANVHSYLCQPTSIPFQPRG